MTSYYHQENHTTFADLSLRSKAEGWAGDALCGISEVRIIHCL